MTKEQTAHNQISDEDIATIEKAFERLEDILYPQMAIIRAAVNGELSGKDIRQPSTFEEIRKAFEQLQEIKKALAIITNTVGDQRQVGLGRINQKALAYFREVEEAARKNVPGAQKIYEELKQLLPDE